MENEQNTNKTLVWLPASAVGLALLLRLLGLNSSSLTLNETENALTALHLFSGEKSSQLLYALPEALIFRLFGSSDFNARLFPALTGTLLTLLPLLIQDRIGRKKACLTAFILAVDPVLLFWSKRADAMIPVIAFSAAAVIFFMNGKRRAGLSFLLIACTGGERFWRAFIVSALCALGYCLLKKESPIRPSALSLTKKDLGVAALVLLLFVTAFGTFPAGISSLGSGMMSVFKPADIWARSGVISILFANLIYCGIPWLAGIWDSIRLRSRLRLILTVGFSVILAFWQGIPVMPWIALLLIPGLVNALSDCVSELKAADRNFPFLTAAGAIAGLYGFFYFRLVEVFNQTNGSQLVQITWNGSTQTLPLTRVGASALLTIVSLVILVLVIRILLGIFDSVSIRRGILGGCLIVCSWGLLTNIWNVGGFDRIGDHPLNSHWANSLNLLNGNYTGLTDSAFPEILSETVAKHGDIRNPDYGLNLIPGDRLLEWQLRNFPGIRQESNIHSDLATAELIIDHSGTSYLDRGYAGIPMGYCRTVRWDRFSLMDFGKWMLFGDGPDVTEGQLTIWVRGDYMIAAPE